MSETDKKSDTQELLPPVRALYSRLIKLAAQAVIGKGFLSPYADDNPKTTPRSILKVAERQRETLRLMGIEIREIADQLSALARTPSTTQEEDDSTSIKTKT